MWGTGTHTHARKQNACVCETLLLTRPVCVPPAPLSSPGIREGLAATAAGGVAACSAAAVRPPGGFGCCCRGTWWGFHESRVDLVATRLPLGQPCGQGGAAACCGQGGGGGRGRLGCCSHARSSSLLQAFPNTRKSEHTAPLMHMLHVLLSPAADGEGGQG